MTQLTEADYDIDNERLLYGMGIDPHTVVADSVKIQFIDGKAVLTYSAMRAIPPRVMAMALLASATTVEEPATEDPEPPTPIRKRATKKAVAKK